MNMQINYMKSITLITLILVSSILYADNTPRVRLSSNSDALYSPKNEEGYIQGWNFFFKSKDINIFATFLVSNIGPGSLNNGVGLAIFSNKIGNKFLTKEHDKNSFSASKSNLFVKIYNNNFTYKNGVYEVQMFFDDIKLNLKFRPKKKGIAFTGDKYIVQAPNKFVKADILFSFAEAKGYIDHKGEIIHLNGEGGMEHLTSNYEVYKYSKRWEIYRAKSKNGYQLYLGGFGGSDVVPGGIFKVFALQDSKGNIVYSSQIEKNDVQRSMMDDFSGYVVPVRTKYYPLTNSSCSVTVERSRDIGKINILANISVFLRLIIQVFFSKPYQLNFVANATVDCPNVESQPIQFNGILTYYLINPD